MLVIATIGILAGILSQKDANNGMWQSIVANVCYSLVASVIYAGITDIAATKRMQKKYALQYDTLLLPLVGAIEQFYVDLVPDNRRLESHDVCKRDFAEWAEFFATHYDDESIYDADVLGDLLHQLGKIQEESERLRNTAMLRFDHDKMGARERSGFKHLHSVAGEIIELLKDNNIEEAMRQVGTRFKVAVQRVYEAAPFDRKVDCDEEI